MERQKLLEKSWSQQPQQQCQRVNVSTVSLEIATEAWRWERHRQDVLCEPSCFEHDAAVQSIRPIRTWFMEPSTGPRLSLWDIVGVFFLLGLIRIDANVEGQ